MKPALVAPSRAAAQAMANTIPRFMRSRSKASASTKTGAALQPSSYDEFSQDASRGEGEGTLNIKDKAAKYNGTPPMGYLLLWMGSFRRWQRRFFVASEAPGVVIIYKRMNMKGRLLSISLRNGTVHEDVQDPRQFIIATPAGQIFLRAVDSQEREKWLLCLSQSIEMYEEKERMVEGSHDKGLLPASPPTHQRNETMSPTRDRESEYLGTYVPGGLDGSLSEEERLLADAERIREHSSVSSLGSLGMRMSFRSSLGESNSYKGQTSGSANIEDLQSILQGVNDDQFGAGGGGASAHSHQGNISRAQKEVAELDFDSRRRIRTRVAEKLAAINPHQLEVERHMNLLSSQLLGVVSSLNIRVGSLTPSNSTYKLSHILANSRAAPSGLNSQPSRPNIPPPASLHVPTSPPPLPPSGPSDEHVEPEASFSQDGIHKSLCHSNPPPSSPLRTSGPSALGGGGGGFGIGSSPKPSSLSSLNQVRAANLQQAYAQLLEAFRQSLHGEAVRITHLESENQALYQSLHLMKQHNEALVASAARASRRSPATLSRNSIRDSLRKKSNSSNLPDGILQLGGRGSYSRREGEVFAEDFDEHAPPHFLIGGDHHGGQESEVDENEDEGYSSAHTADEDAFLLDVEDDCNLDLNPLHQPPPFDFTMERFSPPLERRNSRRIVPVPTREEEEEG